MPNRLPTPLGVAAVVVGSLLFALNGTVAKLAMQAGLSPTRLVEIRCVGSAVVLIAVVLVVGARRLRLRDRRELVSLAVLGVVGVALVQWLYLTAISRLPVGVALLIEYTAPLLVALWARFVLKDVVHSRVWWALVACLGGLTLVAQVGEGVVLDALGVLAAVGSAVSLAAYYLLGARMLSTRDPLSTHAWTMTFAAVFWVVLQPVWTYPYGMLDEPVAVPGAHTPPLWVLVAWIVVLGTVVPYLLYLVGIRSLGPARAGLLGMVEPVAASASAWLVLDEAMTAVQLVGGVIVLGGVVLAETARTSRPDDEHTHVLPDTVAP